MRGPFRIVVAIALIAAAVAIGVGAYNAGYTHGVEAGGKAVEVVRTVGPGWGFFPFGFFIFPLFFFALFAFARRGRRWGGRHPGHHWDDARSRFEERSSEWHRRQHERDGETKSLV